MFNARNMRVLSVVSVALFLLFSSVNMVPARSFLGDIINHSKRQKQECPFVGPICFTNDDCIYDDVNCNFCGGYFFGSLFRRCLYIPGYEPE